MPIKASTITNFAVRNQHVQSIIVQQEEEEKDNETSSDDTVRMEDVFDDENQIY